jgi:Kef-type K+ transport system membrane component KefB
MNSLTIFGFILLLGLIGGHLAHATRFFPRVTGYILIGLIFGPDILGIITPSILIETRVLSDVAVGLVLFQLGLQVNVKHLYQDCNLLWTAFAESSFTFFTAFCTLYALKINILCAGLAAAISVSSSPALTLLITNQHNNVGLITQRSLTLVAINNIIAFCFYMMLLPFLYISIQKPSNVFHFIILAPLYRLIGSIFLAGLSGCTMLIINRFIGKQGNTQFQLVVGILILVVGLAKIFYVSPILTPLILGIIIANKDKENNLKNIDFGHSGEIFFIFLFVLTGAKLHFHQLITVGWTALAYVLARLAGKCLPVYVLSRLHGLNYTQSFALGLTLLPIAGMAIGLVNTTLDIANNEFTEIIAAIVLASVAMIEIISPLITIFALKKTGELNPSNQVIH